MLSDLTVFQINNGFSKEVGMSSAQQNVKDSVKEYYGKTLSSSDDLQTDACCTDEGLPDFLKPILSAVHDEVLMRYYGCGLVLPEALKGMSILDLGCGAGRDVYALAQLVGETGRVVGVDMTDEQLAVAREHQQYHTDKFKFKKSNVEFHKGYIEALDELPFADGSFDIIVSNCVINLSPDKLAVLKQAKRLLKPGGEMYFSDVYADRRISEELQEDEELYGECLSGALYWNDFENLARKAGFNDPRLVKSRPLQIQNEVLQKKLGSVGFWSATYRLFAIDELEPSCEEYGQAVIYQGGIEHHEDVFELDGHHTIEKGKVFPVCGNTWHMLRSTRFEPYFTFIGDFSTHYGIFTGCGTDLPFDTRTANLETQSDSGGCC